MFNIGFGELAIICIVLIIAVGPERLPSMMKTLGKTIRTLRQASRDIRASTGIDELLREDFDLYSPPPPPRRPAYVPPTPDPAAPAPVSRQDALEPGAATPPEPASLPANAGPAAAGAGLLGGSAPQPQPDAPAATPAEPAPAEPAPLPAGHEPAAPDPGGPASEAGPRPDQPKQPGS